MTLQKDLLQFLIKLKLKTHPSSLNLTSHKYLCNLLHLTPEIPSR